MKKFILTLVLVIAAALGFAQRVTDKLDRGLVAVPSGSGNLVSWRIFGEEYYDVTYNLYCNGSLLAENLKVSNYTHAAGNASSKYQVAAVVRGVEQEKCKEVKRWESGDWSGGMLTIPVAKPTDRNGNDASSHYVLNDVSLGDLDGDGIVEFIVKRKCDAAADVSQKIMFHQLDCYDHKGKRLWWIDLGPNMLAGADEQWDCVCYDWDQDGKAEVLLRIQDNAYIHYADGTTQLIGSASVDTRWDGIEYTSSGNEYLIYLEGATGKPYEIGPANHPLWMDYPLTRQSDDWWGKGIVGHRSTKHYWGAPFLDGRKASIFLGRGCYTNHKFTALDVDPATHKLTQRWYWQTDNSASPWWGNGYHNFAVGDVDWDGRDEIIFGSMIIDDNGLGLNTTSYGHGDAQHCSDFDPYRKYEEQFACLEEGRANFGFNYRNAATGQMLVKHNAGGDDGRALMANFTNEYPGSVGRSVSSGWVSSVADKFIDALGGDAFIQWGDLNQRIYWDGDLLDEYFDSPGTEGYGAIYKPTGGRWNFPNSKCNNWSKNNPGAIADIFGDWREELVMRKADNTALLVYSTGIPTTYRIPTLWHDHQYRNAMVWQSMGYNQPPHKSYFLGELEGITQAPPPLTMTGRTEVPSGGTITTTDKHLIVCEMGNTNISIQDGASPYMVTFNVPSWVQGTAAGNTTVKNTPINYEYYTCNVTGGALTGTTRVVKQGDGILTWPKVDMTYTGETNIWTGTLNFDGTLKKSPLWLNRFAELNSNGGEFLVIKADYGAIIRPGGENSLGEITIDSVLNLGFGSHIEIDVYSDGFKADRINAKALHIERKTAAVWQTYGPEFLQPVLNVVEHPADGATTLEPGQYNLGKIESLTGSLANIKIVGVTDHKSGLSLDDDNNLILTIGSVRGATEIVWTGATSTTWDFANATNFYVADDEEKTPDYFVTGDVVNLTDEATRTTVNITNDIAPDTIRVSSSKAYTISGTGNITAGALVKEGTGKLTITNEHTYTGGNFLRGGTVVVTSLSNDNKANGNLGGVTTNTQKFTIENGAVLQTSGTVTNGSPIRFLGDEGGVINNAGDFSQMRSFYGTTLTKKGTGWLKLYATGASLNKLIITAGTVENNNTSVPAKSIELQGGAFSDTYTSAKTTPIMVPAGKSATFTLGSANYTDYANPITGSGTLTIVPTNTVSRSRITGGWQNFEGTIKYATKKIWMPLKNSSGIPKGTLQIEAECTVGNTAGTTFSIGKLTGKGTLTHIGCDLNSQASITNTQTTWQAGNSLEKGDFTFDGTITDNGTNKSLFNKIGTCKMTISGAWTNSGAVQVKKGELLVKSGALLGTGALTVAQGAILSGMSKNGTPMTNSSVTINGTLHPGASATAITGNFNFNGKNVTFGAASTLLVGLRKSATATQVNNTHITNIGTLKLTAGATIAAYMSEANIAALTTDAAVVDSFYVWTDAKTVNITGDLQFDLPELLVYNYWDTSRISEGILYVRCDAAKYQEFVTGISAIANNETVEVQVISTSGMAIDTFTCPMGNVRATFANTTLPQGIYLLHIQSETGKRGTLKLMK